MEEKHSDVFENAINKSKESWEEKDLENKMDKVIQDNIDLNKRFGKAIDNVEKIKFLVAMIILLMIIALLRIMWI